MGITKGQLKAIVKECLVEILAEGIGSSNKSSIQESSTKTQKMQEKVVSPRRGEHVKYSKTIAETIKRESNGNSVMESIFADTAANTLPIMLNESQHAQPLAPASSIEGAVARSTPEQLFGNDVASKWAELAFSETPKKF
ncbi:MAG: hypothetical protein EBU90_11410 [Proteobacteria bacterium]|nr:hypothetical protein [Pseudomonadota bacterium]